MNTKNQSRSELIIKMIIAAAKGTLDEEYGTAWEETVEALLDN